jgi:hypothetical protein
MQTGDLVLVWVQGKITNDNVSFFLPNPANTGGQGWNVERWSDGANVSGVFCWCRYNGNGWPTNPKFSIWKTSTLQFNGTAPLTAVMLVYRPTNTSKLWVPDVGSSIFGSYTAPTTPFTVTVNGRTPVRNNNVSVAVIGSEDVNTWGSLTGTNWTQSGITAQFRNTGGGAPMSIALMYQIQGTAAATNNVSMNQATNGGDAGVTHLITFAEIDPPTSNNVVALPKRIQTARFSTSANVANMAATFQDGNGKTIPVGSGNAVVGMAHFETAANIGIPGISDDQGNKYLVMVSAGDNAFDQSMFIFWLPNITNAPVTVTCDFNGIGDSFNKTIVLHEVQGASDFDQIMNLIHMQTDVAAEFADMPDITPSVNGCYLFGAAEEPGFTDRSNLMFPSSPWQVITGDDSVVTSNTYEIVQDIAAAVGLDLNISRGQNVIQSVLVLKPSVSVVLSQNHYRFRNDDGSLITATFAGAKSTPTRLNAGTTYRVRSRIENGSGSAGGTGFKWQYNLDGAGWNDITSSSAVVKAVTTANFTDGADVAELLTGAYTYVANNDSADTDGAFTLPATLAAGTAIEVELAFQLISVDTVGHKQVQLRVVKSGGGLLDAYYLVPTILMNEAAAASMNLSPPRNPKLSYLGLV